MISARGITCGVGLKLRTSFIYPHRTAVEHGSIQCSNGALSLGSLGYLNKGDASGFACVPVRDDGDAFDSSVRCKKFLQLMLRHGYIQVP